MNSLACRKRFHRMYTNLSYSCQGMCTLTAHAISLTFAERCPGFLCDDNRCDNHKSNGLEHTAKLLCRCSKMHQEATYTLQNAECGPNDNTQEMGVGCDTVISSS